MLTGENLKLVEDFEGLLIDKKNKLCFKMGEIINIPSSKFPVEGLVEVFSTYNTFPLEDELIEEVFNSYKYLMGRCYSNSDKLLSLLREHNITDVYPYSGWLIIGKNQLPVHHSFLVLKRDGKNYVLDYAADIKQEDFKCLSEKPKDSLRLEMIELMKQKENVPNSKKCCFGKVDSMYLYIASVREPNAARDDFNKLMSIYPDHISYRNVNKQTGASKLQSMYYNL